MITLNLEVSLEEAAKIIALLQSNAQTEKATFPLLDQSFEKSTAQLAVQQIEKTKITDDAAIDLDDEGQSWDENIHSPNKTKNADGTWRKKKNAAMPKIQDLEPANIVETVYIAEVTDDIKIGNHVDSFEYFDDITLSASKEYTDADMSKICNQAASSSADINIIKKLIAETVPEGQVSHSRNIPLEKRVDFVQKLQQICQIEFIV